MKILVFNGSPKKKRSDTMHITRAFLGGMNEAAPQEVQSINVADMHIEFCRGCFACKYNGGRCAIDDDMREILEQMLASDLLLFSFPLYCYGIQPAQHMQQGTFSGAGFSDNGDKFSLLNLDIHMIDGFDLIFPRPIKFAKLLGF